MNKRTIAGIVTFDPDTDRLRQNIAAISGQVEAVLIIDNGSANISEFEAFDVQNLIIIKNGSNKGIAYALNRMMEWAYKNNYGWVITLDQDSVCPPDYITAAKPYMKRNIGQIVPLLYESNSQKYCYMDDRPNGKRVQYVHKSITSASITSVEAWKKLGGFDNDLFIDYVDFDYSIRLRMNGYRILRLNDVALDQQLGNSVIHKIGFLNIRVSNHSAFRKYYICRNITIFIRKYKLRSRPHLEVLRLFKVLLFTILFEDRKKAKLRSCLKGLKDGIMYDIDKNKLR